jgi:hypothetical protein
MRMKTKAVLALLAGGLLLSVGSFAGRLDGSFATQDDANAGLNQACTVVEGDVFRVNGQVIGAVIDGCAVTIDYSTPLPHKARGTALKSGKTEGSAKVSQSIDANVVVTLAGAACGANVMVAVSDAEKCKVSSSIRGDASTESVESGRVSVSCDLGENGANLDTDPSPSVSAAPNATQFGIAVDSFDGRSDVKLDTKGKLKITQKGVPDTTAPAVLPCTTQTTSTTSTTSTTTTTTSTTTTTLPT